MIVKDCVTLRKRISVFVVELWPDECMCGDSTAVSQATTAKECPTSSDTF